MPEVLDPGFITYAFRATKAGDSTELANFGVGYGVRILAGAHCIKQIRLVGRAEFTTSTQDFHDGQIIAAPRGFARLFVDWCGDSIAKVSRIVLEVLTVPAAVWATTDGAGAQGSKILWESALHIDPSGTTTTLTASGGGSPDAVLADIVPGDFYQGPEGPTLGSATLAYPHRATGDERPRWYPTPALYFDGWIGTAGTAPSTDVTIIIYAYGFSGAGTPTLHFYKELGGAGWVSQTVSDAIVSPTTNKRLWLGENSGIALAVPADGFKIVAHNSHAVNTYTLYGRIGARSA